MLANYFNKLRGKERVKVICIDLSSNYRNVISQLFPNAKIVADRFHVIRLLHHQCMLTFQEIDPSIKNKRCILAALRTHPNKLSDNRLIKRDNYLKINPAINAIYDFKQRIYRILMKKSMKAKNYKRLIPLFLKYINDLKLSPFKRLITLGNTLINGVRRLFVCGGSQK